MPLNVSQFRSNLARDGARPNRFEIILNVPTSIANGAKFSEKLTFMARATQAPDFSLGVIAVPYQGRDIKVAGNHVFQDWTVTVYNDEDFSIRNALEKWSNAINTLEGNVRKVGIGGGGGASYDYVSDGQINQLSKFDDGDGGGTVIKTYTMISCWPSRIGGLPLDWARNNEIQDFDVTFTYDWCRPNGPGADFEV